jgi:aspartyl-tRNA synthetase
MLRTTNCGALRGSDADQLTTLNGWVHRIRNHGGITFISLRDRYGITQVVVDEGAPESLTSLAESLRMEFCIAVQGLVRKRPDDMINQGMATGEIEVLAQEISILSKAPVLPFTIEEENQATENTRLEYRFLDLRSPGIQNRLILRHKVAQATRDYLNNRDFLEIETPTLIKSTPEGARDYLVPSRVNPGKFLCPSPVSPALQAAHHGGRSG